MRGSLDSHSGLQVLRRRYFGLGPEEEWSRITRWSVRHPELDGAMLGPILFGALLLWRSSIGWLDAHLAIGWCVGIGVLGLVVGGLRGRRRRRWLQDHGYLPRPPTAQL